VILKEKFLYTAEMVREMDRVAIEELGIPGLVLMRRAAQACVNQMVDRHPTIRSITVFCGNGNNAGDGYIIAGILADRQYRVQVIEVGNRAKLGADASAAFDYCQSTTASFDASEAEILGELIVDALLGTGLSGPVRNNYSDAINRINDSSKPVLAVDIPSGICADTGSILGNAIEADLTVTFIGPKRGLYTNEGPDHAGLVVFDSLGVPYSDAEKVDPNAIKVLEPQKLGKRRKNSYKTSHGHVLVIGGDHGMGGAVIMASEAALRVGAGLVSVATRIEHSDALLARRPEVMVKGVQDKSDLASLIKRATTLVVGPGLGQSEWSKELMRTAIESKLPMIIDADGLNLLAAGNLKIEFSVLTPHPGEAARLLDNGNIQEDRFAAIGKLQQKYGGVVLLKGVGTLVTNGEEISLCPYGNPGMATAGMGDVLSGIIGGLLAQGLSPYDAATQGAVIHALAGDLAAKESGERGLVATDLLPFVRELVNAER
jgi:ADP-dependent NAD(P)H-hydrate dehydratase / NAD(P)H-hydrate epimerase